MTLNEFMSREGLDDDSMARKLGCSSFAVKKWRYRERIPRAAALARISKATKGAVTANDFHGEAAVAA